MRRSKNSLLVLGSSLKDPIMQEVTVLLLIFWTPRMTMQVCMASMTTPTPLTELAQYCGVALGVGQAK